MNIRKIAALLCCSVFCLIALFGCGLSTKSKSSIKASDITENNSGGDISSSSESASASAGESTSGQSTDSSSAIDRPASFEAVIQNNAIVWTDVSAYFYLILIDGKEYTSLSTQFKPDLPAGVYLAEVRAYISVEENITVSAFIEYAVKIQPPNVKASGWTLSWDDVEGAVAYNIYKESAFITQITGNTITLSESGKYYVCAVAEDERMNSDLSEGVYLGALALTAPHISIEKTDSDRMLVWDEIPGAQMYYVCFNGQPKIWTTDTFAYIDELMQEYPNGVSVTVYARAKDLGDGPHSNEIFCEP